jgi:hypothetical protein
MRPPAGVARLTPTLRDSGSAPRTTRVARPSSTMAPATSSSGWRGVSLCPPKRTCTVRAPEVLDGDRRTPVQPRVLTGNRSVLDLDVALVGPPHRQTAGLRQLVCSQLLATEDEHAGLGGLFQKEGQRRGLVFLVGRQTGHGYHEYKETARA